MTDKPQSLTQVFCKIIVVVAVLPFTMAFIAVGIVAGLAWGNIITGWNKAADIIDWGWHGR